MFSCLLQAIAIVLGFLVGIGLIILMVFAIRTRSQMNRYGTHRVLWEEPHSFKDGHSPGIEKWVRGTQWVMAVPNQMKGIMVNILGGSKVPKGSFVYYILTQSLSRATNV